MNPAILDAHRARAKAATAKPADGTTAFGPTDLGVIGRSPRQEFTPRSRGAEKLFDRTSLRREEAAAAKRLFELADRDQSGEVAESGRRPSGAASLKKCTLTGSKIWRNCGGSG